MILQQIPSVFKSDNSKQKLISVFIFIAPISIFIQPKVGSITCGLFLLLSLFLSWNKISFKSLNKEQKRFLLSVLIFLFALALSIIESDVASEGLSRFNRYLKLILIIPLCITLLRFYSSNYLSFFILSCSIANFLGTGIAMYEIEYLQLGRASGGGYHPIFFGNMMVLNTIVLIGFLFSNIKNLGIFKYYLIVSIAVGIYGALLSGTRGAWLTLLISPLLAITLQAKLKILIPATLLTIVTIVLVLNPPIPNNVTQRIYVAKQEITNFIENPNNCSSLGARFNMWNNAVTIASDSPVLGAGLNDYKSASKKLIQENRSLTKCKIVSKHTAHSNYFHILAESGLLGLGSLLYMFYTLIILSLPKFNRGSVEPFMVTITFITFGLTTTWLAKSLSLYVFMIYIGLYITMLNNKSHDKQSNFSEN